MSLIRWLPVLFLTMLQCPVAHADGVSIYPTTLFLDKNSDISTLTISNQSDRNSVYELAGYRWTETGDEETLTLDKSFIVTPPVVTLAPGEQRIVRVGLMSDTRSGPVERAYRLRISELNTPDAAAGASLKVRLQLLLPVFSTTRDHKLQLGFSAHHSDDGRLCIAGSNEGDTHAKLVWIAPADAPEQKLPVQKYVLAKSQAEVCVKTDLEMGQGLVVGATSAYQRDIQPYEMSISDP